MRFLKTQTLNRRAIHDNRVELTIGNTFTVANSNNMVLPISSNSLSAVQSEGMIRYNPTSHEVEVYSGSPAVWRTLRYKESNQIVQQNLGAGDSDTVYFGPLSTAYDPSKAANGAVVGSQNILVIVENVIQISGANYEIVSNPSIGSETYNGTTSATAASGANKLYFNTSLNATTATGNGSTVTITFPVQQSVPFAVGSTIVVTGFTPTGYNGTYTVTASTASSVSYSNASIAAVSYSGNVTSNNAVYPAVNIMGATVSGTNIPGGTVVTAYTTDTYTDALTSITVNNTFTGSIGLSAAITIAENAQTGSGYYLHFSSPPPYGKTVTVLIGFDQ